MNEMNRKKELKQQYKMTKPPMGVFIIKCLQSKKCHIQTSKDLRASINGALVRLKGGFHPYAELQKEWKEFGSDSFEIETLDELSYGSDDSITDYTEELNSLKNLWDEKLKDDDWTLYNKRL